MTDPDCQDPRAAAPTGRGPGLLFSDRGWILKVGLTLVLLSLLCRRAPQDLGELHPGIEEGIVYLDHARGKTIQVWAYRVLSVTPDGFDVDTKIGRHRVTCPSPPPAPGELVSLSGRIVDVRRLELVALRTEKGFFWKRGLNYGLSSLTVLAFLLLVRRRFRLRLREGLFRSRY